MTVRPTLRCLREDLRLPIPSAVTPLDQVEHPLLTSSPIPTLPTNGSAQSTTKSCSKSRSKLTCTLPFGDQKGGRGPMSLLSSKFQHYPDDREAVVRINATPGGGPRRQRG